MQRLERRTLRLAGQGYVIESPPEALRLFHRCYPHGWLESAIGPADFSLAADGDSWRLARGDQAVGTLSGVLQAVRALEYEVESRLVAQATERVAFHAGGVAAGGRAHLVAGGPDAGKSTATLLLVELGHRFLCEEVALVEPQTLQVEPHLRTLELDAGFLDELAARLPIARGEILQLDDDVARYSPYRLCREPAPLDTIFLPRLRPGRRPRVDELEAAVALPEILGHCFAPSIDEGAFFDRVIHLLEGCRVVRIQFDGIATARRLWQELLPPGEAA